VNPAIAASIVVLDGLRTTDADHRSFTKFTKRTGHQLMLGPFGLVRTTFFSSGDRIRTCDLWVMS
jgi:hypothetical protein